MLRSFPYLLAFILSWALPCGVAAGQFSVSPVKLDFIGNARSQLLSITNGSDQPAGFLVRGAAWTMTEAGAVEFLDDDSLIVFPATFTLPPKGTQNIRVGTAVRAGQTEKTWRVILEELPDTSPAGASATVVNVLSIISVPVFMPPISPRKALEIAWQAAAGKVAKIETANTGNVHQVLTGVSVAAMRGDEIVQQAQEEGWYILPGETRAQPGWCRQLVRARGHALRTQDRRPRRADAGAPDCRCKRGLPLKSGQKAESRRR